MIQISLSPQAVEILALIALALLIVACIASLFTNAWDPPQKKPKSVVRLDKKAEEDETELERVSREYEEAAIKRLSK